jgi:hypothetical protein
MIGAAIAEMMSHPVNISMMASMVFTTFPCSA